MSNLDESLVGLVKITSHSFSTFQEIVNQQNVYQAVVKRFVATLGQEEFDMVNTSTHWNRPDSDAYKQDFLDSKRPVLRQLAEERLHLWNLLFQYSNDINLVHHEMQKIVSSPSISAPSLQKAPKFSLKFSVSFQELSFCNNPVLTYNYSNCSDPFSNYQSALSLNSRLRLHCLGFRLSSYGCYDDNATEGLYTFLQILKKTGNDPVDYKEPALYLIDKDGRDEQDYSIIQNDVNIFNHGFIGDQVIYLTAPKGIKGLPKVEKYCLQNLQCWGPDPQRFFMEHPNTSIASAMNCFYKFLRLIEQRGYQVSFVDQGGPTSIFDGFVTVTLF
jgi:hypothetical protein